MAVGEWIQASLAVATFTLAAAAFLQMKASARQANAAEAATQASQDAVREALRSRIDDRSPSVVMLPERPSREPLLDRHRKKMPFANELRLLAAESLHRTEVPTEDYAFPESEDWFLWFKERVVLSNEGDITARVRTSGETAFVEAPTDLFPDRGVIPVPAQVGDEGRREYLLAPGHVAVLEWAAGHTLGEWADAYLNPNPPNRNGAMFLTLMVRPPDGGGIVDHLYAEASARPFEPVPGRDSQWRLKEGFDFGVTVLPTQRTYLDLGESPKEPPWATRFQESKGNS